MSCFREILQMSFYFAPYLVHDRLITSYTQVVLIINLPAALPHKPPRVLAAHFTQPSPFLRGQSPPAHRVPPIPFPLRMFTRKTRLAIIAHVLRVIVATRIGVKRFTSLGASPLSVLPHAPQPSPSFPVIPFRHRLKLPDLQHSPPKSANLNLSHPRTVLLIRHQTAAKQPPAPVPQAK